jgi:hypothetical protein
MAPSEAVKNSGTGLKRLSFGEAEMAQWWRFSGKTGGDAGPGEQFFKSFPARW